MYDSESQRAPGYRFQYQVPPTSSPASNTWTRRPISSRSLTFMYMPANPAPITTTSTSVSPMCRLLFRVCNGARLHRLDHLLETALAARQHQQGEEAVRLAVVATEVHRDPGGLQRSGIGLALVAQHVVLGGEHDGGWQTGEVGGAQR